MNKLLLIGLLAVGAASAGVAQAQTVWRCGADGRSYSDSPCVGGQTVEVSDPRSVADRAEAQALLTREQRLGRQLVAERREREREARANGNGLIAIKPADAIKPPAAQQPLAKQKAKPKATRKPGAGAGTSRSAARAIQRSQG